MLIECQNCGHLCSSTEAFCPRCGAKVVFRSMRKERPQKGNNDNLKRTECRNCGHVCSKGEEFCPVCGKKLIYGSIRKAGLQNADTDNQTPTNVPQNNNKNNLPPRSSVNPETLNEISQNFNPKNPAPEKNDDRLKNPQINLEAYAKMQDRQYTFIPKKKSRVESLMFNLGFYMLIAFCLVLTTSFVMLNRQTTQKTYTDYKTMISNPSMIPELKEPTNIYELISNLSDVEKFLYMYLKFSGDSEQLKGEVFAAFLREMNKFPHITNETLITDSQDPCSKISSQTMAKKCADRMTKELKYVGINAYPYGMNVYLYPDLKFIKDRYSAFLPKDFQEYLTLSAKYNVPSGIGLNLYMTPKALADKIADYEKLLLKTKDNNVKERVQNVLYDDFRRFIFTPSIYDTQTWEMSKDFKHAYDYYILKKRDSALQRVMLNYMERQRNYDEYNFKNDYPYKKYDVSFENTVENSTFNDVFASLRSLISQDSAVKSYAYVYNLMNASWQEFESKDDIRANNYILSGVSGGIITVYNNLFTEIQQIGIPVYSRLYLINNTLLIYDSSKLALSKVVFNGSNFSVEELSSFEISSIFPGVEIIPIDVNQSRLIEIQKDNARARYMLLSPNGDNFSDYQIVVDNVNASLIGLPNMFEVHSNEPVSIAFVKESINGEVDPADYYTINVTTAGYSSRQPQNEREYAQYDSRTAEYESQNHDGYQANIKPKIEENPQIQNAIQLPPEQRIEPPNEPND